MSLEAITQDTVQSALRAMRYVNKPNRSPLLDLDLVSLRLRDEDVADTRHARSWILGRCLWDTVEARLQRLRGGPSGSAGAKPLADAEFALLKVDLRSGSAGRLDWALMRWRYLSPTHRTVREVAHALGMTERTVQNRVAHGVAGLTDALRQQEVEASRRLAELTDGSVAERVMVDEQAPPKGVMEVLGELQGLVNQHRAMVRATPAHLQAAARHPVAELTAYRLGRIAEWSQPRYRLDSRFVELSLLVDLGEESRSGRWQAREERFSDLRDVLAAVNEPAIVILGPPGSGKSTLLRRLELELACDGQRPHPPAPSPPRGEGEQERTSSAPRPPGERGGERSERGEGSTPLTFLVSLNQYRPPTPASPLPPPREWLAERWAARYPQLPPLADVAAQHRMVYLLDGLNEVPHRSPEEYRARIALWKQFLLDAMTPGSGHRAVVACRSLDYSAPLSTPAMRVPQVQLEPLSDEKVEAFLRRYSPEHAAALRDQLRATAVLGALRWPFFLRLLVEEAAETGRWEGDLAGLLTAFVRRALVREIERHNPRLEPNGLLDARDYERVVSGRGWRHAYELPERGALFRALSELAHGMQEAAVASESSQVRIGYEAALELLASGDGRNLVFDAEDAIRAGEELGLLDEDRAADEVMFQHQLLQEYFAARKMAREPRVELVRAPWRVAEITPGLREILDNLPPSETLPALPTTGWEETTVLAAAMAPQPEAFVRAVMPENLVVAGRAASLPTVRPKLSAEFLDELRWALAGRSRDPNADLRARIEAGLALGPLGDPRFLRREGPHGAYLVPPMVAIPGGEYPIGEDELFEGRTENDHMPRHTVLLQAFTIGQFAITNAEYACFMAAGGYEEERWWATEGARAWRSGEGTAEGSKRNNRWWWRAFLAHPELLATLIEEGRMDEATAQRWQGWVALDEAEFEAAMAKKWPDGRFTEPRFWRDLRYNNPAQPVVGVCWYEARAYCAWLTAQTDLDFSLPSEAEREAASRGRTGRRFAYGEAFDALGGNTFASHVKQPSPVGVFVEGDTPEGASDLAGNSADWTSSLYGRDEDEAEYRYPYDATDGREDEMAGADMLRVVRGGSWFSTMDESVRLIV